MMAEPEAVPVNSALLELSPVCVVYANFILPMTVFFWGGERNDLGPRKDLSLVASTKGLKP